MNKSSHAGTGDQPENQNNAMSNDPADGNRTSFVAGKDGTSPADKKPPEQDEQDQSAVETFGEEGAGVAAKE